MIKAGLAHFRLKFKHAFGLAHGVRDGTDALYLQVERQGLTGRGEVTFPPYLPYQAEKVANEIGQTFAKPRDLTLDLPWQEVHRLMDGALSPPARNVISMACMDLFAKGKKVPLWSYLQAPEPIMERGVITLGITPLHLVPERLSELPDLPVLKLKLGGPDDKALLKLVTRLTERPLFLDANQGLSSVNELLHIVEAADGHPILGIEQPFSKDRPDLVREFRKHCRVPVYGDESIQGLADLAENAGTFDGVNIKLMKCGGLDVAWRMASRAKELGMRVMLGTMSEGSLGCCAMGHLGGAADVVDLDGPWLIANDPFTGVELSGRQLGIPHRAGIGAEQTTPLPYDPICT